MVLIVIFLVIVCIMSLTAFILYGMDKKKAKNKKWRIRESVLLGIGFFGGAIGALSGMHAFRHKTKHWYFWVVNILGLLWQVGVLFLLFWKMK